MPSSQTSNYKLNQWSASDKVLRTDFNADNAKIDAAIKAEADARTAAVTALNAALAKRGNCQMHVGTYTGTGESGQEHPTSYTFPVMPLFFFILQPDGEYHLMGVGGARFAQVLNSDGSGTIGMNWNGNTVSWSRSSPTGQYNVLNCPYTVVAFSQA